MSNIETGMKSNDTTLSDIDKLQKMESKLFTKLETGVANNTLDEKQKTQIADEINQLSDMRMGLYQGVNRNQDFYEENVKSAMNTVDYQLGALDIVEQQLNEAKKRLHTIEEDKYNKLRLVEINQYYSQKYANQTSIIKTFIFYTIILLIINVLHQVDLVPSSIHNILIVGLIVIALIHIGTQMVDAYKRSNMYYDEYNFPKPVWPPSDNSANGIKNSLDIDLDECIGQQCCSADHTYVTSQNKCMSNTSLPQGVKPYSLPTATSSLNTVSLIG
jgi:hypothetical protein